MAPESLRYHRYSQRSDVFAFGVMMWEVWSGGEIPFALLDDERAAELVKQGGRPEKPDRCPDSVWDIMGKCWSQSPEDRPVWRDVKASLQDAYAACADPAGAAEGTSCLICMDNPREFAVLPCGHLSLCESCTPAITQRGICPYCRGPVQGVLRIYTP